MPVLDEVSLPMSSLGEQYYTAVESPAAYPSMRTFPSARTFPAADEIVETPGPHMGGLGEGSLALAPLEEIG